MVLALALAYLRYGGLGWMQGAFYGIGAAVIAIIARSAFKLTRLTLGRDVLLWGLFAVAALVTAWTESEIVWVFLGAGALAVLARSAQLGRRSRILGLVLLPPGLLTGLSGPAPDETLWRIGWYFAEAGSFVFGSGLAIVPFLHGGVVREFGWLSERQFLDAVAVAMITPGPVVITVGLHRLPRGRSGRRRRGGPRRRSCLATCSRSFPRRTFGAGRRTTASARSWTASPPPRRERSPEPPSSSAAVPSWTQVPSRSPRSRCSSRGDSEGFQSR